MYIHVGKHGSRFKASLLGFFCGGFHTEPGLGVPWLHDVKNGFSVEH